MTDACGPVVSIDGLAVRYGRSVAVRNLKLDVEPGCVYALLGRNGAGKTSTVRCLLGQRRASAGRVKLFGRDVWQHRSQLMSRVGVVPERAEVPPGMTAKQLGRFFSALYSTWTKRTYQDRLTQFQIPATRPFRQLSKGQQRQLSLALALATSPALLVLDDPTLGLDAVARRELLEELIVDLADRGTTLFVATNDIAGIEGVADRVGILRDGSLLIDDTIESLKDRFRRVVVAGASALKHVLHELPPESDVVVSREVAGGVEVIIQSPPPASTLLNSEVGVVESMSLEEIFIALCGPGNGRES